ncbi:MAG: SPOR domain-containing protein [Bacteroidetes bacterium]|nr:SPOR domain-containing protein [Bacteroidota bacterium]
MKLNKLFIIFSLILLNISIAFAQEKEKKDNVYSQNTEDEVTIFKPTAGLGIGILSYFGDVGSASFKNPMTSRLGYQFLASTRLNSFFDINLHFLVGKVEANERSFERNLNFQAEIRSSGLSLSYNFHQLLPKNRKLDPFVSLGIESVEFLSKTDIYDSQGNRYNYWRDGSLRNLPEEHPNAVNAIHIQRDYIFETDIRESNIDGFGRYSERTFAIPAGIGLRMYLYDNLDFKIGTTFHYTFSNLIDGVTENSKGTRIGNSKNDHFLYSSFSLNYRFNFKKKSKKKENENTYSDVDYTSLDDEDIDADGVKDFKDDCPGTPSGVKVNINGCPLDNDNDGVPDFLDQEPNTHANAFVDVNGVTLTDEAILLLYETYMDSTGKFAIITRTVYEAEKRASSSDQYKVQLGIYNTGIPPELINKFLSLTDITSTESPLGTIYSVGNYSSYNDAVKRKNELLNSGLEEATVALIRNGKFITEDDPRFNTTVKPDKSSVASTNNKSENISQNLTNETNKSLSNNENSKSKTESISNSTTNTNAVKESTIKTDAGSNTNVKTTNNTTSTNTNKVSANGITEFNASSLSEKDPDNQVVFRIQLGAYSRKLSKNIFEGVDNLIMVTSEDGLVRYLSGSFTDYNEAVKEKINVVLKGYNGSFIVAYKNGKRIPLASVGATKTSAENLNDPIKPQSAVSKDLIKFKVQIGAFKNEVPADIRIKYNSIKGLETQQTPTGLTRYISGTFSDYNQAVKLKNEMINTYGISDAFIVAYFKDQMIPVQEALELIK